MGISGFRPFESCNSCSLLQWKLKPLGEKTAPYDRSPMEIPSTGEGIRISNFDSQSDPVFKPFAVHLQKMLNNGLYTKIQDVSRLVQPHIIINQKG